MSQKLSVTGNFFFYIVSVFTVNFSMLYSLCQDFTDRTRCTTVCCYCFVFRCLKWLLLSLKLIQNIIATSLVEVEQMVCGVL